LVAITVIAVIAGIARDRKSKPFAASIAAIEQQTFRHSTLVKDETRSSALLLPWQRLQRFSTFYVEKAEFLDYDSATRGICEHDQNSSLCTDPVFDHHGSCGSASAATSGVQTHA
jgi:hypothetical protein